MEVHGPRVVAIGGGHGTAVTLRAMRRYAGEITAIVSVADDGGSSGRLRQQFDTVALGDIRKCLIALATPTSQLAKAFEHRFTKGADIADGGHGNELAGHALGNLVLAGLIDVTGDLVSAVDSAAELLGATGRVLPATSEKVSLKSVGPDGEIEGQVAVSAAGKIHRISLVPGGSLPPDAALDAIANADQIVIGPGSLFTSIIAAVAVTGVPEALKPSTAQKIYVANLYPQMPETEGFSVGDHVAALVDHGIDVDYVLFDQNAGLEKGIIGEKNSSVTLRGANPFVHDPILLGAELARLYKDR